MEKKRTRPHLNASTHSKMMILLQWRKSIQRCKRLRPRLRALNNRKRRPHYQNASIQKLLVTQWTDNDVTHLDPMSVDNEFDYTSRSTMNANVTSIDSSI